VVLCGTLSAGPEVAVLAELEPGPWAEIAAELLYNDLGEQVPVSVYVGPRGSIERTSSGKPRRRVLWERLRPGESSFDLAAERQVMVKTPGVAS
jgi:hypothetical protein